MQYALGVVEKISIRRKAQNVMIESNIIEWIYKLLQMASKLQDFTLEYLTALLMNLSLRTEGKKRCEKIKTEMLKLLKGLLTTKSMQILTHINGTLYSLFTYLPIKLEARVLY
jgi:hypothetical protein